MPKQASKSFKIAYLLEPLEMIADSKEADLEAAAVASVVAEGGGGGDDYASPVAANGKIYIMTNAGTVHVIEAGPELKVLATNDMSFDSSGFGATPAISDGCLFLRSNTHLYCVGAE